MKNTNLNGYPRVDFYISFALPYFEGEGGRGDGVG